MTNPANAASREAQARRVLYEICGCVEPDVFSSAAISENVVIAAMLALADEAASQPREGVSRSAIAKTICEAMGDDPAREGPWDEWYSETPYAIAADHVLAALHDTAPTDQAQRGGAREARALLLEAGVHENTNTAIGLVPYPVAARAVRAALAQSGKGVISTPDMPKGGEQ